MEWPRPVCLSAYAGRSRGSSHELELIYDSSSKTSLFRRGHERNPTTMSRQALFRVAAPPALGILVWSALPLACGLAELREVAQKSAIVIEAGEKCLLEAYEAEQELCLTEDTSLEREACVLAVRAREFWQTVIAAIDAYHQARCRLEPAKCPTIAPPSAANTSSSSAGTPRR